MYACIPYSLGTLSIDQLTPLFASRFTVNLNGISLAIEAHTVALDTELISRLVMRITFGTVW